VFKKQFIQSVESAFSQSTFRIDPATHSITIKDGKPPSNLWSRRTLTLSGVQYQMGSFAPKLKIVESTANYNFEIYINNSGTVESNIGGPGSNLHEDAVNSKPITNMWKGKDQTFLQVAAVHEFGHLLGLDHPGQDVIPRQMRGSREDYAVDAPALMGDGMEMRPQYFKLWKEALDQRFPAFGPFTIK
jgi:hypothetical protein